MKRTICLTIIFALLISYSTEAAVVGVSPSIVKFNNMLKGGYADVRVTASTSFDTPLKAHFETQGEVGEWIRLQPSVDEFIFSKDEPYTFNMIIEPPEDTQNGNYTGRLEITTDELATVESGAGSSVIAQVAILIYVEVTGEETIACNAGAIATQSAEVGDPFLVRATVDNKGNVRLRPEVIIEVWDQYQTRVVKTYRFLGQQILPTNEGTITQEIENDLELGQYFADVFVKECGVSRITTFDIVGRGQLADSGKLLGIHTNDITYEKETMPIFSKFTNTGKTKVIAQFKGEIVDLDNNKIVHVLESDSLEVNPGETTEFRMFYVPEKAGDYQISGRILYNNKLTFEEKSKVVQVVKTKSGFRSWIFLFILYLIIGLIILILIGKIRKARKK